MSAIYRPKPLRLYWDSETGWVVDVPSTLSASQLMRIAAWALPIQIDRIRSLNLMPGDKLDELKRSIKSLERGEINQRLIDHDGDGVFIAFASTTRVNPERTFFH